MAVKSVGTTGSVNGIVVSQDNTQEVLDQLGVAVDRALTMIGIKVEKYAKALCPVGTPESTGKKGYRGGTLRNSITFNVSGESVTVGSNVEYAPYVELGTGPYFKAPPEWEQFDTPAPSGIGGGYVRPRPFLRPAITDHISEYSKIVEDQLKS